jgi:hypothetical protein
MVISGMNEWIDGCVWGGRALSAGKCSAAAGWLTGRATEGTVQLWLSTVSSSKEVICQVSSAVRFPREGCHDNLALSRYPFPCHHFMLSFYLLKAHLPLS